MCSAGVEFLSSGSCHSYVILQDGGRNLQFRSVRMSNDDGGAMEEGGAEIGPLVQPLVGSVDRVFTGTRLASLDAFRGLAIAVYLLHLLLILILILIFSFLLLLWGL